MRGAHHSSGKVKDHGVFSFPSLPFHTILSFNYSIASDSISRIYELNFMLFGIIE